MLVAATPRTDNTKGGLRDDISGVARAAHWLFPLSARGGCRARLHATRRRRRARERPAIRGLCLPDRLPNASADGKHRCCNGIGDGTRRLSGCCSRLQRCPASCRSTPRRAHTTRPVRVSPDACIVTLACVVTLSLPADCAAWRPHGVIWKARRARLRSWRPAKHSPPPTT